MDANQDPAAALTTMLAAGEDSESAYQTFLEERSELIPVTLDSLNHGVQWQSVISKFEITRDRVVDFAFVTKSSDTWRIVFIELERPSRTLFLTSGYCDWHSATRGPIAQVESWKTHVDQHKSEVRESLRPLVHLGHMWDTNPIEFRYMLITGRHTGEYSRDQASCIARLRNERGIRLLTWDSVVRHAESAERDYPLNVLVKERDTFRIKRALAHTSLFGTFLPHQITVREEEAAAFRAAGYDIDRWLEGNRLTAAQGTLLSDVQVGGLRRAVRPGKRLSVPERGDGS